jgi:hypothetical protein
MKFAILLFLILVLNFGCASKIKAPEVVNPEVEKPANNEVNSTEPPLIVLDQERLAPERDIFVAKSSHKWVQDLVKTANCIANNQAFFEEVSRFPKYELTDRSSMSVANHYFYSAPVDVRTYWYYKSKVIATTYTNNEVSIYLNTRANPRPMPEMIETVFHETGHLRGFSHGDNYYSKEKENTVNYKVAEIAGKYVKFCE